MVNPDEKMVAVVEIKGTDWDRMTVRNVRANVRRHARQVWIYIDSLLQAGKEVCPGIIFPRRPKTPDRLEFIESLFDEQGIPVVWQDEAIEDCRNRNSIVKKPR